MPITCYCINNDDISKKKNNNYSQTHMCSDRKIVVLLFLLPKLTVTIFLVKAFSLSV